jgi:glycosyltransferase involved in cell wall biosynthesis
MSEEILGVSIIVLNYNYGRFLAAAIDSALNQDHPVCEVIVVDDGSTDDSRTVIASYGDRIRSLFGESNKGQVTALNGAWPLASHPILIFLDADDLLLPHAAATVARCWTPTTVKTQSPLVSIDESGRQLGHIAPKFPPNLDTATIRRHLLRSGQSILAAASGNAYSRALLDRISADGGFELENPRKHHMDMILECNAPFYGEVITVYQPLAYYRIHGSNLYTASRVGEEHFVMFIDAFAVRLNYLAQRCRSLGISFDLPAAWTYALWPLECQLCVRKLTSNKGLLGESLNRTLFRGLRACVAAELPISHRLIRAGWFVSVAASPRALAKRLIALRFVITERPSWFERLLSRIVNIGVRRCSSLMKVNIADVNGGRLTNAKVLYDGARPSDHTHPSRNQA